MSVDDIVGRIGDCPHVCLTGGEPLIQEDMPRLIDLLLKSGKTIDIETNGSVDLSVVPKDPRVLISMDYKCPSSGMTGSMKASNLDHLGPKDQLKFVIADENDLDFAVDFVKDHSLGTNIIFGPVGGTDLQMLVGRVLDENLDVRVLPQLHKLIWGDKKGV